MHISFLDLNLNLPPSLCFAINLASYQFFQSRAGVQSCMGRKSCRRGNVTQVFSHVTTPVCLWTRPSILPRTALQCLHLLLHPVISSSASPPPPQPQPHPVASFCLFELSKLMNSDTPSSFVSPSSSLFHHHHHHRHLTSVQTLKPGIPWVTAFNALCSACFHPSMAASCNPLF